MVLPGAESSTTAAQDFRSLALIGRARTSIGSSFAGILFTDREVQGGGHNRVIGPDFLWKIDGPDRLLGQVVISDTANPPAISGEAGSGHAARLVYTRDMKRYDIWSQSFDYSPKFRADDGFIPIAGVHGSDDRLAGA